MGAPGTSWIERAPHRAWLDAEAERLLAFGVASRRDDGGFGWLDARGQLDFARPVATWITARMTHVFALGLLRGRPGCTPLVDHGLAALAGPLRDPVAGGWVEGTADRDRKVAYTHAFVVLAASSATLAGRPTAPELLAGALEVVEHHFLDTGGLIWESYDESWTDREPYRGANSAMHLVEALLAAADATGENAWRERALAIAEEFVHRLAPAYDWLIPEHRDGDGAVLKDLHRDQPDHPFRPYGATPGHALEWSRLLIGLEAALTAAGSTPPSWLLADARHLFATAVRVAWSVDGSDGFVYTVDWDGQPVVRTRLHWVLAEAIAAAATLHARTGEEGYEHWYRTWWDHAATRFLDPAGGSWWHELDPRGHPASSVWSGKPDVYHAFQATLIPALPLSGSIAGALARSF